MSELTEEQIIECQRIVDAVIDYNMAEIYKKMDLHGLDFEMASEMQMAVILAGAN